MSAEEFGGVDFALGSVRGFRSWGVDFEGKLKGVSHTDLWVPGDNVCVCHASVPKDLLGEKLDGENYSDYYERVDYHAKQREWKAGSHGIEACKHGFYAYFQKDSYNGYGSAPVLNGVIEGFGEVVIGTKGFRAAKARILALSFEPMDGIWQLHPLVVERIQANYPGAATFGSTLAMLSEFPLANADDWAKVQS